MYYRQQNVIKEENKNHIVGYIVQNQDKKFKMLYKRSCANASHTATNDDVGSVMFDIP